MPVLAQVQGLYRVAKNGRTPSRRMDRIPSWINLQTMGAALEWLPAWFHQFLQQQSFMRMLCHAEQQEVLRCTEMSVHLPL